MTKEIKKKKKKKIKILASDVERTEGDISGTSV